MSAHRKGRRGTVSHYSLLSGPIVGSGVKAKDEIFATLTFAEMSCRGVWRDA